MNKVKKSLNLLLVTILTVSFLSGCNTADPAYQGKIDTLKSMKKAGTQDNVNGKNLQQSLRDEVNAKIAAKDYDGAYKLADELFIAYSSVDNGYLLISASKAKAKNYLDNKNYQVAFDTAGRALQVFWDEDAMGMKLAAEVELLNAAVAQGDLKQGKTYYSNIMDVTSLKGNEKLAEKYRASAEKYSDKFPKDTKPDNEPTATIVK